MIEYVKGKIDFKTDEYIVIGTGPLGYRVFTSLNTIAGTGMQGEDIKLYTYLYIREESITLYGFSTTEELGIFKLLISVSGVGPKAAMAILSVTTPATFGMAVVSDDADALSKAQGVGKKTAQRIILELKDKIKKSTKDHFMEVTSIPSADTFEQTGMEAVNALMVLGYTRKEAVSAVSAVRKDCNSLEDIIKLSLKKLTEGTL